MCEFLVCYMLYPAKVLYAEQVYPQDGGRRKRLTTSIKVHGMNSGVLNSYYPLISIWAKVLFRVLRHLMQWAHTVVWNDNLLIFWPKCCILSLKSSVNLNLLNYQAFDPFWNFNTPFESLFTLKPFIGDFKISHL